MRAERGGARPPVLPPRPGPRGEPPGRTVRLGIALTQRCSGRRPPPGGERRRSGRRARRRSRERREARRAVVTDPRPPTPAGRRLPIGPWPCAPSEYRNAAGAGALSVNPNAAAAVTGPPGRGRGGVTIPPRGRASAVAPAARPRDRSSGPPPGKGTGGGVTLPPPGAGPSRGSRPWRSVASQPPLRALAVRPFAHQKLTFVLDNLHATPSGTLPRYNHAGCWSAFAGRPHRDSRRDPGAVVYGVASLTAAPTVPSPLSDPELITSIKAGPLGCRRNSRTLIIFGTVGL